MSSSSYIYETIEDYMKFYPTGQPKDFETPVEHLILKNDDMIRIIVPFELKGMQPKPPATKSIYAMLGGHEQYMKYWEDSDEVAAKVYYTPHSDTIEIQTMNYNFHKKCDRYMGDNKPKPKFFKKKYEMSPKYMFFDVARNRINFILNASLPVIHK